ncbi:hypothetical protein GA0116948_101221 [Chitinophaga costaii]|uniref:Transcriptional regulator, AbiEi antitoxin, Type IV TA system n=1 Tax=Chitinophaga costaii TaxID=1335309 RepID=A0A1C3Z3L0_9BACT|nr:hypothetical protein [Chitinophaga costaii]PUZ30214.1 hypothetical protein DCM91_01700 [Chitinophaga costaii]SCB76848.1 hypothetical protein GA0116948_101221 [Chitinophaga costaii]
MPKVDNLKFHLRPGQVYRRENLQQWTTAVDRHLAELVEEGTLKKVAPGMYYFPKATAFGDAPPADSELVRAYLKDDEFLLTSPNDYNGLGVGTTQLYNKTIVYNHKRHGDVKLGNRVFSFQRKPRFPKKPTVEFLLVDLVNNLSSLAEDPTAVLGNVRVRVQQLDARQLKTSVKRFGSAKTQKLFASFLQ